MVNGITIFKFTDPIIALEHFATNKEEYALVISDLRMPSLNGMELVRKIKQINPSVRTLLMSAFEIDHETLEYSINQKLIDGFLQKPISLDNLCLETNKQLHDYEMQKLQSFISN